jgi:hypothetical protein
MSRSPVLAPEPDSVRVRRKPSLTRSAVEHRPADVVPQPLVVKHELANTSRELVTLPLTFEPTSGVTFACRRGRTCGLDRVGGRTELVRGNVRDDPGLASGEGGVPRSTTEVSGRRHRMAARRTSLHHRGLATHPGAGMLDRPTRSRVCWLDCFEEGKDVLRARCCPQSEKVVIRVGESPTAADRHESWVRDLRQNHGWRSLLAFAPHPRASGEALHPSRTAWLVAQVEAETRGERQS